MTNAKKKKRSDRGSISINGKLYDRARAKCDEQGITMTKLVESLTAPILSGEMIAMPDDVRDSFTKITTTRACTCALCTRVIAAKVTAHRVPLGKDDTIITICVPCNEEHPREGRYNFGGGAKDDQNGPNRDGLSFSRVGHNGPRRT